MRNKLYIFLTIAFVSLILMLGSWGLTESSEARYATIAKEMVLNNNFLNPTLLGIKHFQKPPVTYYITALSYKIFGINEFGARFFMQLALVFQIFLVYKITLLLYKNKKIAFAASLIYFSFPITIIAVRTLTTDAFLTTFMLAGGYFWLRYKQDSKTYFLYLFYFFLGLIIETKGPVGLIIPISFIASYKIINKEKIEISIHQFLGFLLFLGISSAWYIAVIVKNEGLFDYFFYNQLVERVSENKFRRGKPFWYYLLIMPFIGIPWLFYLIFYLKSNLKSIIKEKGTNLILLITFLVFFTILSLSTSKLVLYVLPLFFILAIYSANFLSKCQEKVIKSISNLYVVLILLIASSVVMLFFLDTDISINLTYALINLLVFGLLSLLLNKFIYNTNYLKPGYLGVLFILSILFTSIHVFKENELNINSVKPMAEFIKAHSNNNSEVFVYNYLLPSLSFYLDEEITTINNGRYTTQREVQFQKNDKWKKYLINYFDKKDRNRILSISTKEKPTFLIKLKKETLPDTLILFQQKLKHKMNFKKFEVYY
ncbi:MAG: glycosyltransferase family 39 protein [Lutibacter sp.]|nr:glycosyltransferase family 39 protein [Lutibacter sp.]